MGAGVGEIEGGEVMELTDKLKNHIQHLKATLSRHHEEAKAANIRVGMLNQEISDLESLLYRHEQEMKQQEADHE
jgi:hypothetical protein